MVNGFKYLSFLCTFATKTVNFSRVVFITYSSGFVFISRVTVPLSLQTCLFHCRRACNLSKNILISHFHDDDIWLYNYQNSFGFFFLTEICQSRWGLNNNSPNLHEKTTNVRILVVVVMKALDKIWGNSRGPLAVKRLSHDVFVLFIRILLTLNRKRWQEFCKLF